MYNNIFDDKNIINLSKIKAFNQSSSFYIDDWYFFQK